MAVDQAQLNSEYLIMGSVMGIGDGGCFSNFQENPQQTPILLHQQQGFPFLGINSYQGASSASNGGGFASMGFSQSLAALLEKQRRETDWVLQVQNERLKTTLQKVARQEISVLLQNYELKIKSLMWQKDQDLAISKRKTIELEQCLRATEMENQTWQQKAQENEAKIAELDKTLTQVRERVNGAESVCDFSSNRGNRVENKNRETEEERRGNMGCRLCSERRSCVVFLPCRHLCSCKYCEAFVVFCPICESVKEGSMEVFMA